MPSPRTAPEVGTIERVDGRLSVLRPSLDRWAEDDTNHILRAALAAYDRHRFQAGQP